MSTLVSASVRYAGIERDAIAGATSQDGWTLVTRILALSRETRADGARLADLLYPIVGEVWGEDRSRLVALRRALHTGRQIRAHLWPSLRAELPAALAGEVHAYVTRTDSLAVLRAELERVLRAHESADPSWLRSAWLDAGLRHGLSVSSPTLDTELTKWLAGRRSRPLHQHAVSLLSYVARAAMKTSPWSTFTVLAALEPEGAADAPSARVVVEPDIALLASLEWSVRRRQALALRPNPTLVELADGTAAFIPHGRGDWLTVRLDDSSRRLLAAAGGTTAVLDRPTARLLDIGLLEADPLADDQCLDHLGALIDRIGGADDELLTTLRHVRDDLDHLTGDLAATACWADADAVLRHCLPASPQHRPTKRTLFEHAVSAPVTAGLTATTLDRVTDELGRLAPLLDWLDPHRPLRQATAAYARQRYGEAEVPWLMFDLDLAGYLGRPDRIGSAPSGIELARLAVLGYAPEAAWRHLPYAQVVSSRLARLRAALEPATGPDGVARLTHEDVTELTGPGPYGLGTVDLQVQLLDERDGALCVVNAADSGYGRCTARTRRLLRQAGLPTGNRTPISEGVDVVEIPNHFGSNVNLRDLGHARLAYPGTAEGIPVAELKVRLGQDSELVLVHGDRTVRPVHRGQMAGAWLPGPVVRLTQLFGRAARLTYPSLAMAAMKRLSGEPALHAGRFQVGDVVVLRETWSARTEDVPQRAATEPAAAFWLRLATWAEELGMPRELFLRVLPCDLSGQLVGKERKPLYVDLASPALVSLLMKATAAPGHLAIVTEALPSRERPGPGVTGRVTELALEVSPS